MTPTEINDQIEEALQYSPDNTREKEEAIDKIKVLVIEVAKDANPVLLGKFKQVMSDAFSKERTKQRLTDPEKNRELTNYLGDALTNIEMSVKNDLKL